MAIQVKAYRPPVGSGVPYENWKDEAACDGKPTYFFELSDELNIVSNAQQELIARGLKICTSCPVKAACLADSSPSDRHWTTRGGQPPEGLFPYTTMPPLKGEKLARRGFKSTRKVKSKCKRGHENWQIRKDGNRRCLDCTAIHNEARKQRG